MSLNLFDFTLDGSLIPYGLDQDIRAAIQSSPTARAALDKLEGRFNRLEVNKQAIELEISAAVAITVTVLQQLKDNHHEEKLKKEFRTQVLGGLLQFSHDQVSRIVKAAEVQLYSQHLPTAERKLLETTSSHGLYEFSKLNKFERKACLAEHLHLGKELSARSTRKFKRPALSADPQVSRGIYRDSVQPDTEQSLQTNSRVGLSAPVERALARPVETPGNLTDTETSMPTTTAVASVNTTEVQAEVQASEGATATEVSVNGETKTLVGGITFKDCVAIIRAKAAGLSQDHRTIIRHELNALAQEISEME